MIRTALSIHLSPTAPLAPRALLPADPGLALGLAQALLEKPRMFNHTRGLWGYTGLAADGLPLTIQSTGIGGPSAAVVLDELAGLGLRRAIRVGTCSVVGPARPTSRGAPLGLGDLLIVEAAVASDGTSRALGTDRLAAADGELTAAIRAAMPPATRRGVILSTDVFYARPDDLGVLLEEAGVLAVDLESAALLTLGRLRGVAIAGVVVVADLLVGARRERIDDQRLEDASQQAGRLAAAGLLASRDGRPPATSAGEEVRQSC